MKYKIILYLDLGFIPKISHYVYANIPKSEEEEKNPKRKCFWSLAFWMRWDLVLGLTNDSDAMPKIWAWNLQSVGSNLENLSLAFVGQESETG